MFLLPVFQAVFSTGQIAHWEWAKNAQGSNDDVGRCITKDFKDNIYVAGYFSQDYIQFGGLTLHAEGGGMFLVKYDASGNVIWGITDSGNANADALCIATDANGNVFVAGTFLGSSITVGNFTLYNLGTGFFDTYVAKFDSLGHALWAKSGNGSEWDIPWSIAVDKAGSVYMTGGFTSSSINFSGVVLDNASRLNIWDMFLVKYDAAGSVIWARRGEDHNCYNEGSGVTVDSAGNIYVTGYFTGDSNYGEFISFGTVILYPFGGDTPNYFFVKYNPSGDVLWAKTTDYTTGGAYGNTLCVDKFGNAYVLGEFSGDTVRFGNSDLINAGGDYGNRNDIFIIKYDSSGQVGWAHSLGSAGSESATGISLDINNNLYVAGSFANDNISIGNIVISNPHPGSAEILVVKCDSAGNYLWAKSAGGIQDDGPSGICSDSNQDVYIVGSFLANIDFDNITLNSTGGSDFFIAKLGPNLASSPLPLVWGSFTAEANDNVVLLKWTTLQEINTSHFDIERSANDNSFSSIGRVDAVSNSLALNSYQFIDASPLSGMNFYRLKQVDENGKYVYSKICTVNFNSNNYAVRISPNPVSQSANITYSIQQNCKVSLQIFDVKGRRIKTLVNDEEAAGVHRVKWDVSDEKGNVVPAGLYFLKMMACNNSETKKIIVNK